MKTRMMGERRGLVINKLLKGQISEMVLKVLSSEIDPAEIRFIRKAFIKEREARRFLEKFARPPSWGRAL